MDALQEFIYSLPDSDRALIKMIPLTNTDELLKLDHDQFNELVNRSISVEDLSSDRLHRREELINEIYKIRNRLILKEFATDRERHQLLEGCITVSEAIRRNSGKIRVKGIIVSLSAPI